MNFFGGEAAEILDELEACGVFPIVYAVAGGREMFSYLPARCTRGMRAFLETRKNDRRANPVATRRTLRAGDIFYFTCIDEREKLLPFYEKYREQYHCVFQVDLYTREQWLEIMPKAASKASAALWLKSSLGCGRLVVFGDGDNGADAGRRIGPPRRRNGTACCPNTVLPAALFLVEKGEFAACG